MVSEASNISDDHDQVIVVHIDKKSLMQSENTTITELNQTIILIVCVYYVSHLNDLVVFSQSRLKLD